MEFEILDYPELPAITKKAEKLVVMIHGIGSDGDDLISLAPYIQKSFPNMHFISPHGVEQYDMAHFGRQWFSIRHRSQEAVVPLAEKARLVLEEIITKKQKELSLSNKDTILIGFSQGTMMAIYTTLSAKEPYAATIAFSGRVLPPQEITNKSTPICIIHGKNDDVIDPHEADFLEKFLMHYKIVYDKLMIDNLAHSIDAKGMSFAIEFIKKMV